MDPSTTLQHTLEQLQADSIIAHHWFALQFGEIMNGRDFAVKCSMANTIIADIDATVTSIDTKAKLLFRKQRELRAAVTELADALRDLEQFAVQDRPVELLANSPELAKTDRVLAKYSKLVQELSHKPIPEPLCVKCHKVEVFLPSSLCDACKRELALSPKEPKATTMEQLIKFNGVAVLLTTGQTLSEVQNFLDQADVVISVYSGSVHVIWQKGKPSSTW